LFAVGHAAPVGTAVAINGIALTLRGQITGMGATTLA
jgi:hypothetical protein